MGHRPIEEVSFVGGLSIIFCTYVMENDPFFPHFNQFLTLACISYSIFTEGFRLQTASYYLAFLVQFLYYIIFVLAMGWPHHYAFGVILLIGIVGFFQLQHMYGKGDFSKVEVTGPYYVGAKEFRTSKFGNETICFYPIDQKEYRDKISTMNMETARTDYRKLAHQLATNSMYQQQAVGQQLFSWMFMEELIVPMNVAENSELAQDFLHGKKNLRPIFVSHGLNARSTSQSCLMRELASYGYIVFSLNHKDRTCLYTETRSGTPITYNTEFGIYDKKEREKQLSIRVQEIIQLREEVINMNAEHMTLMFGGDAYKTRIDIEELVVMGHNLGGSTAILSSCSLQQRVKAIVAMDPMLHPHNDFYNKQIFCVPTPMQIISTEQFLQNQRLSDGYDMWQTVKNIMNLSPVRAKENIMLKDCNHMSQVDTSVVSPLQTAMYTNTSPSQDNHVTYMLNAKLALRFLDQLDHKVDFKNRYFDAFALKKEISKLEQKWVKYDVKNLTHEGR